MKKFYSFSLWPVLLLSSYGYSLVAFVQFPIFNGSSSAKPGEAISLPGSFSATATIYLLKTDARLGGHLATKPGDRPATAPGSPGKTTPLGSN